ncbi:hypothetical protein [Microseira wollei]|uniref:Uncharacterized protein n=1 Tax=Microseira wollei NIES-4236 TaxID=2530354 RepID=A0AAV3XB03_9CYAN|nr:hypothetical protein [Microseira wollei]GET37796.1 hypothetical protein MiSe_25500 [Microseira wollei NIES-4236]
MEYLLIELPSRGVAQICGAWEKFWVPILYKGKITAEPLKDIR